MRNFFSTTLLIMLLGFAASPAWSQVESVKMRVDGLACPFCAYGLEKKLKEVPGVSKIEIRVDDGLVLIDAEKDQDIALERLEPAVKDAGFTARGITATAVGSILTINDRPVLRVGGGDTELILEDNPTLKELLAALQASPQVRVTGRLEERTPEGYHAHRFSLTVETFQLLDSATE